MLSDRTGPRGTGRVRKGNGAMNEGVVEVGPLAVIRPVWRK
jgi:hypothetical protein